MCTRGFLKPIVVKSPAGLGMTLPDPAKFGVADVCRILGPKFPIDVIEVRYT